MTFLPQFVDPAGGAVTAQILVLGTVLVVLGIISDGIYALLAGRAGDWLRNNGRFEQIQRYFAGGVYLLLGLVTALSGSGRK